MKYAFFAGLALLLSSCGGGGNSSSNPTSSANPVISSSVSSIASQSTLSSSMSSASQISSSFSSSSSSANNSSSSTSIASSSDGSASIGNYDRAISRGEMFFGVGEQFNRYYTDPDWEPLRKIYVSPNGTGNGSSSEMPAAPQTALNNAVAGDQIEFAAGTYNACYNIDNSGTYHQPIVIKGARDEQGNLQSTINCCNTGRRSCFNIELANFVAIDSFELNGGKYGVRVVGEYQTSGHVKGNAVLNSHGHDNAGDPFFTGGSDWFVIQGNKAERGGDEDGHGIYLSNGSDFNIVRYNETNDNTTSDFQINADPISTCLDEGIAYNDSRCDGDAKSGQGDGVSEYMLVENNYFHNGRGQGPNFTSVRKSIIRNNIAAFYAQHGVSFWQETDNPKLGSSNNTVHHNLLIGTNSRELFQFYKHSNNNDVRNNVVIGINLNGNSATVNSNTIVRATSSTTSGNTYVGNMYIGGRLVLMNDDTDIISDMTPGSNDFAISTFDSTWFVNFPFNRLGTGENFQPKLTAPWIDKGLLDSDSAVDFGGTQRETEPELGPWEQ
jgi:hypothetical protein